MNKPLITNQRTHALELASGPFVDIFRNLFTSMGFIGFSTQLKNKEHDLQTTTF